MTVKIINLFGGPGTGKSICAAQIFVDLKFKNKNVELITEYAKDATWEKRSHKLFRSQEYIFAKQHFRISRCADEVDYIVTDSPIIIALAYMPDDFSMPSLKNVILEAHNSYDNVNILLKRTFKYDIIGRNQTEEEAVEKDRIIESILIENKIPYKTLLFNRETADLIVKDL